MSNGKIIFCGFGILGRACLDVLVKNGREVQVVLTHKGLTGNDVDEYCIRNNIKYFYDDPRKTNFLIDNDNLSLCRYIVSVNYRYILPEYFLGYSEIPFNLHGSILPKFRGRTPHVWAIITGENETGVTSHVMVPNVDAGDIIHQEKFDIEHDDTSSDLIFKFAKVYPDCLMRSIEKLDCGFIPTKQKHEDATYYGKRTPEMGYIDFRMKAKDVINFVRAQAQPYPGAYCFDRLGNRYIVNKIRMSSIKSIPIGKDDFSGNPIVYNEKMYVRCADSVLELVDYIKV